MTKYDGTVRDLIARYSTDPYSTFRKPENKGGLRYGTKQNYQGLMRRIEADAGDTRIEDMDGYWLDDQHDKWLGDDPDNQHVPMAHSLVGMLRTLATYGAGYLKDEHCRELKSILRDKRFKMGKARSETMTTEEIVKVRTTARAMGRSSVARAQAFQFECILRQRDVIGEWVPETEAGKSDITSALYGKWLRGIRWEEVDADLVLRHVTSKRNKPVTKDLKLMPMVLEELQAHYCDFGEPLTRAMLPATGAIIINEQTGRPYAAHQFRRVWRAVATAAGIPKHKRNMDSRASAITEALRAGARKGSVRKAATHATEQMTDRYDRGDEAEDQDVARARIEDRARRGIS